MALAQDSADLDRSPSPDSLTAINDHCPDWIWEIDAAGRFTYSSRTGEALTGRPLAAIVGTGFLDFLPRDDRSGVREEFARRLCHGLPLNSLTRRLQRPDGSTVVLQSNAAPFHHPDGTLGGYRGVDRDVGLSGVSLEGRLLQLEAIYTAAPVALCLLDRGGVYRTVNARFAALLGLSVDEVTGRRAADFLPGAGKRIARDFAALDGGGAVAPHEFFWNDHTFQATASPVRDAEGHVIGIALALTDISERQRVERLLAAANESLQTYALRDYLTGLPNRRHFEDIYGREIAAARRERAPVALLIADVDSFKPYNDRWGHLAGDECLRRVARAIAHALSRPRDTVFRYGGEEFVAILPATDLAGGAQAAEHMRQAVFDLNIPHGASPLGRITISVGMATLAHPAPGDDAVAHRAALFQAADDALYAAKRAGRNACRAAPSP